VISKKLSKLILKGILLYGDLSGELVGGMNIGA